LIQKRKIENNRIVKTLLLTENGKTHEFVESVRLYSLEEMENLCGQAGLKILEVFGDFDKSAYDKENSKRMILTGKKIFV
ncbi:class I SAM-dependent methyltransferase, partial [bacterium]|nr:class I SAM-dependent methyltransferase [bacterium]